MQEKIKQLETDGYCKIPNVYRPEEIKEALDLVIYWKGKTESTLTKDLPGLAKGHPMVWNLQYKDAYFLKLLFASEEAERILMHFLNDAWYKKISLEEPNYILRSYVARSSAGALPLHIDSFIPYTGGHTISMQCAIILEDMTESNGCTIAVPGSHNSGEYADQSALKYTVPIEAQAGDVVLWDSRLWHGAAANQCSGTRWTMVATFTRWWVKQAFNIPRNLPLEIYEKLTAKERAMLGYCSLPYNNESEGIDMRQGHDSLRVDVSGYRL
jgi:ectoine hydroxylase-related dioxygenase (phytanoyl-CoA dioxygenase family)